MSSVKQRKNVQQENDSKKAVEEAQPTDDGIFDLNLIFLVVGVWVSFTVFGMAQEGLTRTVFDEGACGTDDSACQKKYKFNFTWFLVLLQSVGNTLVAAVMLFVIRGPDGVSFSGGAPLSDWLIVSFSYLGAHKFGMMSLFYIIFPLQVLVKSCKAVPVMVGEAIFAGAKMTTSKIISVLMLVLGVIIFTLAKGSKKGKGPNEFVLDQNTIIGLSLVSLALVCDMVYGPYQKRIQKECAKKGKPLSQYHSMYNMNLYQGLFALAFCLIPSAGSNELTDALAFVALHPAVVPEMVKFSAAMALGNLFIFKLQLDYSSLTVTKTTTVRKLISVFVSVQTQGHVLKPIQWFGAALVFASSPISKQIAKALGETPAKEKGH